MPDSCKDDPENCCKKLDNLMVSDSTEIDKLKEQTRDIKFNDIFYKTKQTNNVLSDSMLLDKLIYEKIGTYLVTYGYSGVGKSFTLFGRPGNGDASESGLLQATIQNINKKYEKFFTDINLEFMNYMVQDLVIQNVGKIMIRDQSIFHYNLSDGAVKII